MTDIIEKAQHRVVRRVYRQRWRIWAVACAAHALGMFQRAALAPMADRLMADFSITAASFGGLGSAYFYTYAAMQIPAGHLADTIGPRKTITGGLLIAGVGSLVMSQSPSFDALYGGRVLVSLGVSVVWVSVIRLIGEWFRKRELATVLGLSTTIVNVGALVASTPLAILIVTMGWRMSLNLAAIVAFGLAITDWLIIRNGPTKVHTPAPVSAKDKSTGDTNAATETTTSSLGHSLKSLLGNKQIWLLFLVGFGFYGSYATLFNSWGVVYIMQTYDVGREFAANFILVATVAMMVGNPLAGFISDRVMHSRRIPTIILTSISLASFLLLAFWNGGKPPLMALYPLCIAAALGCGAAILALASVNTIVPPAIRGKASGLVNMGPFVGAAIAQPLFGFLLDRGWQGEMTTGIRFYPQAAFQQGLILCLAFAVVGLVAALRMKETHPLKSEVSYRAI